MADQFRSRSHLGKRQTSAQVNQAYILWYFYLREGYSAMIRNTNWYVFSHDIGLRTTSSVLLPSSISPLLVVPLTNWSMLPIVLLRGNRSTFNFHSIYNFLSYHYLPLHIILSIKTLSIVLIHKSSRSNNSSWLASDYAWGNDYNLTW